MLKVRVFQTFELSRAAIIEVSPTSFGIHLQIEQYLLHF